MRKAFGRQPELGALLSKPTINWYSPGREPSEIGNVTVRTVEK
jgi:hypothetical protein